ncbi:MAG: CRISPR-associated endonuclease Cas1 [Deferribacteres bacterium]|nr:CRISPR-associated endonuclease Cas1 [Deferribacteres bacterium]
MDLLEERILLELRFRALLYINDLPHYHGPQWRALLGNLLRPYLPEGLGLTAAGISPQIVELGVMAFDKGDPIRLGLSFPARSADAVARMLAKFNYASDISRGHFQPGRTIALEAVIDRVSGRAWDTAGSVNPAILGQDIIMEEIEELAGLDSFHLLFHSPLRLARPKSHSSTGHRFCDEEFFLRHQSDDPSLPLAHFIERLRFSSSDFSFSNRQSVSNLRITGGALPWLDVPYGKTDQKTLGGTVGILRVTGHPSKDMAELLVAGQYAGAGKNAAFGFGYYRIPELDTTCRVLPLSRGRSLLERVAAPGALKAALYKLPNSSPGPDGITVGDLKKAGDHWITEFSERVISGNHIPGEVKHYRMPKDDGGYRTISVQNSADKMLHASATAHLTPVINRLLSDSAWAYRKGFGRKGAATALKNALSTGYDTGLKADIAAFFGSVDSTILGWLLEGFFPFDPLVKSILGWFSAADNSGGLPQGSPLSPVLSNLYLDRFDRDMKKAGFRLVRFSDDFALLFRNPEGASNALEKINNSLAHLGLELNPDKTSAIKPSEPVNFLGYQVSASGISEAPRYEDAGEEPWMPMFQEDWKAGTPVYLTSICRGCRSNGPSLMVKMSDESERKIPWKSVGRLVVVGRAAFSGGVVYRAVKQGIPITFIDVMGRSMGHLYPEGAEMPDLVALQEDIVDNKKYCLSLAKELVAAKIHNSAVLLRRNSLEPAELAAFEARARQCKNIESLRGVEGSAARVYFSDFAKLVEPFEFKGRVYRPPDGPINVMLSLGYTLLYNRLASVLKDKGFNPRIGLMHKSRGRHAALASDLMEDLRHVAERVTLALIHLKEISPEDFTIINKGGSAICRLSGEGFRRFIRRYEKTMAAKSSYGSGERISLNARLDEAADSLKRSLKLGIAYKALRIE